MWKPAIKAVRTSDFRWITSHRTDFRKFFREQNDKPKGKLNTEALEHHYENKLFKIFLAKDLGGEELSPLEGSRLIENAAALEENWGWLLAIGVGGAYFADYLPRNIAEKYFLPRKALVAGSGKPGGKAKKLPDDSWEVKGSWSYCSGSEQASLFTAVTIKENEISAVVLPKEKVRIIEDWNAIGLPLTCSHTIETRNAEISCDHFFDLSQIPSAPYPLSAYPFLLFARACFIPVIVGISRIFWEETENFLLDKEEVWKQFQKDRLTFVRSKQRDYWKKMENMRSAFHKSLEESWQHHINGGKDPDTGVSANGLKLAEFCFSSCAEIYPKLGMQVLDREHPLAQCLLNLQTAWQHTAFHSY